MTSLDNQSDHTDQTDQQERDTVQMDNDEIVIQTKGEVGEAEREYAREKIAHVRSLAHAPVLFTRVTLVLEPDPARADPATAKAELDVNGRLVRAHVGSTTMFAAVDLLEARLRQRLERALHHPASKRLRHRGDGSWRHGDMPTARPSYAPLPPDDRRIVRRKTYTPGPMTVDEAATELELLDYDFFLFENLTTGEDNVIVRAADSTYELLEPSPTCALDEWAVTVGRSRLRPVAQDVDDAVEALNVGNEPFQFFLDPDTGQGRVLYRRYDGHYGLLEAGDV